jgi:phosphatidate cytidylyltransferase
MSLGNTAKRIVVSVIGIPLILAVCYLGSIYFMLFVTATAVISFYEFSTMTRKKDANVNTAVGFIILILLLVNQYRSFIDFYYIVLITIIALTATELFRNKGSVIFNVGSALLGLFYIGLFSASLIEIREFYPAVGDLYKRGGFIIISLMATIWVCDSAAFFGGTSLGRHKLFPRVSPNKSWEGAIFGFFFAVLTMILAKIIVLGFLSWGTVIAFGIIVGTVGQIGDLVESLIKRDAGVKDSSNIIPGHGGIFDRFDSLLYTAPFILLYMRFFGR